MLSHLPPLPPWVSLQRRLGPLVALLLVGTLASAQDRVRVDLERDFPGLIEAFEDEYSSLYEFERFMSIEGRVLAADELAKLQARWRDEIARVEAEVEALRADPGRHVDFKLRRRLLRHHYFRDRFGSGEFEPDFSYPPFVLYVQKPKGEDTGTSPEDVARYGEWLGKLFEAFERDFAEPLGLEMRSTVPGFAIFLLRGREEYNLYAIELRDFGLYLARAHYDAEYRIAVSYQDKSGAAEDSDEIHAAMHEMVHAFQHAYHVRAGEETRLGLETPTWFNEGLAEFLAYRVRRVVGGFEDDTVPVKSTKALRDFIREYGEPGARCVLPLVQLSQLTNYGEAIALMSQTLRGGPMNPEDTHAAFGLLYRQSDLWMHFLYDGADGAHRELLLAYFSALLGGADARSAYARTFAETEPGALDAAFHDWLGENRLGIKETRVLRAARPDPRKLPVIEPGTKGTSVAEAAASKAAAELTLDVETRLAGAVELTRRGRLAAARDVLRELEPQASGPLSELVQRTLRRTEGLVALRQDFLLHMMAGGRKLTLEHGGKRVIATVEDVTESEVRFGSNRAGVEAIKLEELDPLELFGFARSSKARYDEPPLVAYPYLLAGDDVWRLIADGSEELSALDKDHEALSKLVSDAAPSLALLEASRASEPATAAEAREAIAAVARLQDEHGHRQMIRTRRDALRAIIRRAAELTFQEADAEVKLAVNSEPLDDGRIRLAYTFGSPSELDDFRRMGRGVDGDQPAVIQAGALLLSGAVRLEHRLELTAPMTIRARLRVPAAADEKEVPKAFLGLASEEEAEAFAGSPGAVYAKDPEASPPFERHGFGREWPRDRLFEVELTCDGRLYTVRLEGEHSTQCGAGAVTSGHAGLVCSSDRPVEVAELVLEGHLAPGNVERARSAHVMETLRSVGL